MQTLSVSPLLVATSDRGKHAISVAVPIWNDVYNLCYVLLIGIFNTHSQQSLHFVNHHHNIVPTLHCNETVVMGR